MRPAYHRFLNSRFAIVLIILTAAAYRIATFSGARLGGYDEKLYLTFMWNYHNRGILGIQNIIHAFPTDPTLLQGPLPLRFLYVQAGTWICELFGAFTYVNLARLSLISGIGIVAVGYLLLRKWFSPAVAFLGAILLIVSPLASGLSRRALQDPFFCLMILCAFYYFHEVWQGRKITDLILLGFFLLASFLTKETTMVLYPIFFALGWHYRRTCEGGWPVSRILIVFAAAPLFYLAVMWWVAGDFATYFSTYTLYASMQKQIEYAQRYQQGPWFRYIIDLLLISPLTYLFSVLCFANEDPAERRGRKIAVIYSLSILAVFSFLVLLNLRTIFFIDVPLRGLSAAGAFGAARYCPKRFSRAFWIVMISVCLVSTDLLQFFRVYWLDDLYDPTTFHLIHSNGFIR